MTTSGPMYDEDPTRLYECDRTDCAARRRLTRSGALCIGHDGFRHPPSRMEAVRDDERGETPRAILSHEGDWRTNP